MSEPSTLDESFLNTAFGGMPNITDLWQVQAVIKVQSADLFFYRERCKTLDAEIQRALREIRILRKDYRPPLLGRLQWLRAHLSRWIDCPPEG